LTVNLQAKLLKIVEEKASFEEEACWTLSSLPMPQATDLARSF